VILFWLMVIFLLTACGAPAAATEPPEAPAAEELPEPLFEGQGTVVAQSSVITLPASNAVSDLPTQTSVPVAATNSGVDVRGASVSVTPPVLFSAPPIFLNPTTSQAPPVPAPTTGPQPAIPERRRLTLEFPPQIRVGDSDRVRLTLEVDEVGNITPTAEVAGNIVSGEVIEIPNVYKTHRVIAGAQFDIAGMQVTPPDRVSQSLAPGQSITFYWSILPERPGVYRGTIWLYVTFVENVSGEESERAVSAQPVEIEAVNNLGLSGGLARSFGVFGSVLGTVLGFPFLEDIVRFLFGKRKNK
jgi:hypothetical protein